jgi:hypothetical protein
MSHIATAELLDGKAVEWMEKVSDAQYQTVPKIAASTDFPFGE